MVHFRCIEPLKVDSLTQFKLTIDSDGIIPALRGLMLYNSYSVSARQKWSDISQIILSNLPSVRFYKHFSGRKKLLKIFPAIKFNVIKLVPKRNSS